MHSENDKCLYAAGRSGLVVSESDYRVRGPRFESYRGVVFIAAAAAICSLGHGLHTFTAVPRSTQPCIHPGSLNRVPALAEARATSTRWQITVCNPMWHVSSRSGVAA